MVLKALQIGLYVQVALGLARFGLPYVGVAVPDAVWTVHPLLGVTIAVTALVVFRPGARRPARPLLLARYAPLAPLALGIALLLGGIRGLPAVVAHMLLGFIAVELVGKGIEAVETADTPASEPAAPEEARPT
ncbi:MAG TPA: hypothetical protein VIK95_01415 [Egibacteraceae bacterium]